MIEGIGQGIGDAMGCMMAIILFSVPLGIWKLVEIIIWIVNHISISIN